MQNTLTCDVLIIGGGLTAYRAAVSAVEMSANVIVVEKGKCASPLIMGFNAPVGKNDSGELYYSDLVESSCHTGNNDLKRILAEKSADQVDYFESRGLCFDRTADGEFDTVAVLGCSVPRLVHSGGHTGAELLEFLRNRAKNLGVRTVRGTALKIACSKGEACGAHVLENDSMPLFISSPSVIIACGGNGGFFKGSTYPKEIIGDSYALALQAGARLVDMEFQQYEPCCFAYPESLQGKLAVTTMLLRGGRLLNSQRREFMLEDGRRGYRVQKNVLAGCIMEEVRNGRGSPHDGVYYDVTGVDPSCVKGENGIFYNIALSGGIDLLKEVAEVAPAPHTQLGGILIDSCCKTNIPGLFAAGEAAGGLHGANRIGGCSGSETLVFGDIAGREAAKYASSYVSGHVYVPKETLENPLPDREKLNNISRTLGGILKYDKNEEDLFKGIYLIKKELAVADGLASGILLGIGAQLLSSVLRKESRGVFYRTDYPETDSAYDYISTAVWVENGIIESCQIDYKNEII